MSTAVLDGPVLSDPALEPTDTTSSEALLEQLSRVVLTAADGDGDAVVGIGSPSVIEFATGRALFSANVPLVDVPLRQELGDRTGLSVVVDNDATVAALAEACDESGEVVTQNLVMLTVGTGVGGGVIIGGRIFRGTTGAAPELGHIIVGADLAAGEPPHDEHYPQPGSLERNAAGRVLDQLGRQRGYADGPEVVVAARAGEAPAIDALRILGERLGIGIATVINTFDPEEVVIGGGVSAAGELLLDPAVATAWKFVFPGVGSHTKIRLARHGPKAGVMGAALLARHELMVIA